MESDGPLDSIGKIDGIAAISLLEFYLIQLSGGLTAEDPVSNLHIEVRV